MARVNMMLVGQILERIGAIGDAELAGLMGQLMTELNTETDGESIAQTADTGIAPAGKVYVVCVEATLPSGEKVNHPLIGAGYSMPRNIDDVKMTVGKDRAELEAAMGYAAEAIAGRCGAKISYVLVTDEVLADLEKRLHTLLQNLSDAIEQAAAAKNAACSLMNVELRSEDISDDMLREIIGKTLYAGSAVNAAGQVVERVEGEKYVEEQNVESNDYSEDDGDDGDEDDDYCEEEDD